MPAVTRGAARAASSKSEGVETLGLRASVSHKGEVVWRARTTDAYTGKSRKETPQPQVDHCLEVQLAELALVRAYGDLNARQGTMATAQAHELLRDALNDVSNLNVTTLAINQAKRGPFTAAVNRLRSDSLRDVTLEQLARQGKARALVDDGTWARVQRAVVASYEAANARLDAADVLTGAGELISSTSDELSALLDKLGVYES